MTYKEIEAEAAIFFEWPNPDDKRYVTSVSAILFAKHIAELAREKKEPNEI